jgi:hypothetical protein
MLFFKTVLHHLGSLLLRGLNDILNNVIVQHDNKSSIKLLSIKTIFNFFKLFKRNRCKSFNLPGDILVAHCVAEDLPMGYGIAMEFKYKYHTRTLLNILLMISIVF